VLYLAYEFYHRTGDLKAAEDMVECWLAISGREAETADTAAAYGNLGLIYRTRGELDRAEEMLNKSLAINEKLGRQEGMAKQYDNLGNIYWTRGDVFKEHMEGEAAELRFDLDLPGTHDTEIELVVRILAGG
jgi:tetratricopeptide (TPR) repeat protein